MTKSEKLAKQILVDHGYMVESVIKTQWHRNDFFNLWDLIAVKPGSLRFIQISTVYLSQGSHAKKGYREFPNVCSHVQCEFWRWDTKKKIFHTEIL